MKELIWRLVLVVFTIIAVFVTTCTLSVNNNNVIQFGSKLWLISKKGIAEYPKRSLIIITENQRDVKLNSEVFYYTEDSEGATVKFGEITDINNNSYTISGEEIEKSKVIATKQNSKKVFALGTILSILTSKYGYLCLIVLPILFAFMYQIVQLTRELNKEPETKTKKRK